MILVLLILYFTVPVKAQEKRDADERFKEAGELAFSGERLAAIDSCKSILVDHPGYRDVRVFMARVTAWNKNFDESLENLRLVLSEKESDREALNSIIDVYIWSGNPEAALQYTDLALSYHSSYPDFLIKKSKLLHRLERPDEAAEVVSRLLNLYPSNTEGLELEQILADAALLNEITLYYKTDLFPSTSPWHLAYLEYSYKFRFGSLILRANYGNRFKKSGFQIESDGYISIRDGSYAYVNAGYSGASIFPKWRFGIEPYQMLPYAFELSLGLRYMEFSGSTVRIWTGSLGKYLGNYWISYRFYLTPKPERTSFSSAFYLRRYLSDTDNYLTLRIGVGLVSYSEIDDQQYSGVSSKGAAFDFQLSLTNLTFLKGEIDYGNYEYYKGKFRNSYGFKIGVQQRF